MSKETVLIVGATGNIGTAAAIGALNSGRNVLAIVRNQFSADKLFRNIGSKDSITIVEADVTAENGVSSVVDKVKKGELPSFQHVYATVGTFDLAPLHEVTTESFNNMIKVAVRSNFFAYRATVPYLLEQKQKASWSLMTGGAGTTGWAGITAVGQGALFSMANVACRELTGKTNIRFNEVYLNLRVQAQDHDKVVSSETFAQNYEELLKREDIDGCRVTVEKREDIADLKFAKKLA